ncbi:ig-like domain-containing protein [Caerostris extrusa]|uniref:Ig-like domain-containing protein n=1 Tax=Caerostris extrusa TaxID=172846 RepID=A0AAV4V1M7_CAEEX|nr:ig-like domain-containing protein [Caerostris extrusa]
MIFGIVKTTLWTSATSNNAHGFKNSGAKWRHRPTAVCRPGLPPAGVPLVPERDGLSVSPVRLGHRREMVGGTLILRNAEIRDSGRYICVLTSSGNEDRAETELVVTGNTDKWFCIWLSLFWVLQNDEWGFLLVLNESPYL